MVPVFGFQYPENLFSSSRMSSYPYIGLSDNKSNNQRDTAPTFMPFGIRGLDIDYLQIPFGLYSFGENFDLSPRFSVENGASRRLRINQYLEWPSEFN